MDHFLYIVDKSENKILFNSPILMYWDKYVVKSAKSKSYSTIFELFLNLFTKLMCNDHLLEKKW